MYRTGLSIGAMQTEIQTGRSPLTWNGSAPSALQGGFRTLSFPIKSTALTRVLTCLLLTALVFVPRTTMSAAPAPASQPASERFQSPDWVTADIAAQLASANMPVLVPSYIPGAFGSLPSISASD